VPEIVRQFVENRETADIILLTLVALVLLLLIGWCVLGFRLRRVSRQLVALNRGMEGQNLVEVLVAHLNTVDQTVKRIDVLEQAIGVLQAQIPECLQHINLIRYNAFPDVGGEQSFSVALLNRQGDGIVLTSVYSRNDVRVYAKAIKNGQASHPLSQEEERALRELTNVRHR
jgi:hypothetical protein